MLHVSNCVQHFLINSLLVHKRASSTVETPMEILGQIMLSDTAVFVWE